MKRMINRNSAMNMKYLLWLLVVAINGQRRVKQMNDDSISRQRAINIVGWNLSTSATIEALIDFCPECYDPCGSNECIHMIVCNAAKGGCGASTGWQENVERAIKAWNKRAEEEE